MIVKFMSAGKSFKGLATYLTHDPDKAQSADRVAWTHTLNCAHDHLPSAVDECLWTARQAELLKQEAGIRAGGRATENMVKHVSLNWAPDQNPTREQMISASEKFLVHMGWDEHQAIVVAHQEKHPHVHLMINAVHPENGLKLDDNFEQRRASAWALEYERENGRIYCEQRLLDPADRYDAPTRPAWMAFKGKEIVFSRAEKILENASELNSPENNIAEYSDWKKLKEIQRQERMDFFARGKSEFKELRNSIYRDVREEYRELWGDYFTVKREGADPETLAEIKAGIVAEQKATLEERRDEACKELRSSRDIQYRELLNEQREIRGHFRAREESGLDNSIFLDAVERRNDNRDGRPSFGDAAEEHTRPTPNPWDVESPAFAGSGRQGSAGVKSPASVSVSIGEGLSLGILSFFESLADGLTGSSPERPPPPPAAPETERPNPFDLAVDEAKKRSEIEAREDDQAEWRKRQRSPYGD